MYPPSSRDGVDAIVPPQDPRHLFPFRTRQADSPSPLLLIPLLLPGRKTSLEPLSFPSAEVVPASDHVGSVCVTGRIERGEEGEHFGRVPAAAEDDEKVGRRPACACAWGWTAAVEGGEDVDETEEGRGQEDEGGGEDVGEGWHGE